MKLGRAGWAIPTRDAAEKIWASRVLHNLLHVAGGLALTSGAAFVAYQSHLNFAAAGFLELLAVLVVALQAGFLAATCVSVAANLCLNYFFIPPLFTFAITDPQNWVALCVFEISALVVSHLSTKSRTQANRAALHQRDSERLYEVARQMLLLSQNGPPARQALDAIGRVFAIQGVALFQSATAECTVFGNSTHELEGHARTAYLQDKNFDSAETGVWVRILRIGLRSNGAIAVRGQELNPGIVNALASLTALVLERANSLERQTRAEAERQTERLRTAVLDSLAHEYKTPLTAIRAATSGLIVSGGMAGEEAELVQLIDRETMRLSDLTTQLLQMSRLDSTGVKVKHEWIEAGELIEGVLDRAEPMIEQRRVEVQLPLEPMRFTGDHELLSTALVQFVDNAAKYSDPASAITVSGAVHDGEIWISVKNLGAPIPKEDRERIFDRFYRSPAAMRKAPGSGIGLSITRRVADVHRGRVWVESEEGRDTTFYLALPRKAI